MRYDRRMKRWLAAGAIALVAVVAAVQLRQAPPSGRVTASADADRSLAEAFERHDRNVLVEGQGTVIRVLSDDREGNRHQRFILRLASGQTVLVAHNIDLARRIASLRVGDSVSFRGEYEWNAVGGVIHWTHADPASRHPAGWIKHHGETYQ